MAGSSLLAVSNTDRSVWRAPLAPSHMLNSSSFGCQRISSYLLEPLSTIIQTGSTIKFTVFHRKSPAEPLSMLQRHICLNEAFRLILSLQDLFLLPLNSGGLIPGFKSCCHFSTQHLTGRTSCGFIFMQTRALCLSWEIYFKVHKPNSNTMSDVLGLVWSSTLMIWKSTDSNFVKISLFFGISVYLNKKLTFFFFLSLEVLVP